MIPPQLLADAEAAAGESIERYNNKDQWMQYEMRKCGQLSFIDGVRWAFSRLQALSADACREWPTKDQCIIEQQAALLELKEERAVLLNEVDGSMKDHAMALERAELAEANLLERLVNLQAERARAEKLEKALKQIANASISLNHIGDLIEAARQALGENK